jgi:hypothetical protein
MILFFFVFALFSIAVFVATLWSAAQSLRTAGLGQKAHMGCTLLATAGLIAFGFEAQSATRAIGLMLLAVALIAVYEDKGWTKIFPAMHLFFGALLLADLPMGGSQG